MPSVLRTALASLRTDMTMRQFLELDPLPSVVSLVTAPGTSDATRNKAMYCISSTLKHSPAALARFTEINGWNVLNQALQGSFFTTRTSKEVAHSVP